MDIIGLGFWVDFVGILDSFFLLFLCSMRKFFIGYFLFFDKNIIGKILFGCLSFFIVFL